jgi:hypothetical protein
MTPMTPMKPHEARVRRAASLPGDEGEREAFATRLRHCDFLQFWRDCGDDACRRAHFCAGLPTQCFWERVSRMSETARIWTDAGINALDRGDSRRAAAQFADRALLSHLRESERLPRYLPRRRLWRRVRAGEGQGSGAGASWPSA